MALFIPGTVNGKRRRAAMQSALFNARKHRLDRVEGDGGGGPGADTTGFVELLGTIVGAGYRDTTLGSTNANGNGVLAISDNFAAPVFITSPTGINGDYTDGPAFGAFPVADTTFIKFISTTPIRCRGFRATGGDGLDWGNWQAQCSDDGSAWTDVGTPQNWHNTTGRPAFNGITSYADVKWGDGGEHAYWRIVYKSGNTANIGSYCREFDLLIFAHPMSAGDRTASITVTNTANLADGNGHISRLVDGLRQPDSLDSHMSSDPIVGDYFQFQFPNSVKIKRAAWCVGSNQQDKGVAGSQDYGTWKLQASDDGVTFVDAGSPFRFSQNTIDPILDPGAHAVTGKYWRMVYTVISHNGTFSFRNFYEVRFDLENG